MDNLSQQELKLAFFNDGMHLAEEVLGGGINKGSILQLVEQVYGYIDSFNDQFIEHCSAKNAPLDCKKGCAYCCHQSVFVLPYEAIYLKEHCEKMPDKSEFENIKQVIANKNAVTSNFKVDEILNYTKPCPFLVNNICRVYEARPMACRLFLSMNVNSCIEERNNPSDFAKYAQLYELPLHAGRMLNEGICAWLGEKGLKPMEWLIESSMHIVLSDENNVNLWLNGENIFETREISKEEWKSLKKFDLS